MIFMCSDVAAFPGYVDMITDIVVMWCTGGGGGGGGNTHCRPDLHLENGLGKIEADSHPKLCSTHRRIRKSYISCAHAQ